MDGFEVNQGQLALALLGFIVGAVVGALIEIVVDELWGSPLRGLLRGWLRRRARARSLQAMRRPRGSTVLLGNHDTNIVLIDGTGVDAYRPEDIHCKLTGDFQPPAELRDRIARMEADFDERRQRGEKVPWNGRVAVVRRFTAWRDGNDERLTLHFECAAAQFFHCVLTTYEIDKEWRKDPSFMPTRQRLLGAWDDWTSTVPPNLPMGLPVSLVVVTDDNKMLFGNRSHDVAVGPGITACAVNENLHAEKDLLVTKRELSVETLLSRALQEELGYTGSRVTEHPAQVHLLAFAAHTRVCAYALYGYARLPMTSNEVEHMYQTSTRDRWELQRDRPFTAVANDVRSVCEFVHRRRLYDNVGVTAWLALVHQGHDPALIQRTFRELQA